VARRGTVKDRIVSHQYLFAMKALIFVLLGCWCVNSVMSADRPSRGQMKGMELYSWNERGTWIFVLLDGTNRLKSEEEVKKNPNRIDTVRALAARFLELAEQEKVVWNFRFVPGFSFPEEKIFSEVVAAGKRAQINLVPDRT
jgi:hypothetical protein